MRIIPKKIKVKNTVCHSRSPLVVTVRIGFDKAVRRSRFVREVRGDCPAR